MILHILRKDIRHLLPEILLTLILTAALAYTAPTQWGAPLGFMASAGGVEAGIAILAAPFLRILLPIAWLVLIAGVVHDESLVGDRQFWITRPYTWPGLLAEKATFVLLFLHLPLLLMQLYLLHHASLDIPPAIPDLLHFHLRLIAILTLPFFAIATVTATFGRQLITVLAGIAYIAGIGNLGFRIFSRRALAPGTETAFLTLFAILLLALILLQYATRRTRLSRLLLAAVPVLLLLLTLLVPTRQLIERAFPPAVASESLTFDPDPNRQEPGPANSPLVFDQSVMLSLPVHLTGLPPGTRLKGNAVSLAIRTPDGFHWTSPYQQTGADLYAGFDRPTIPVGLPIAVFNRIRNTPVDLDLSIALTRYSTQPSQATTVTLPTFGAPGRGICPVSNGSVSSCLYPLRLPAPIDIKAQVIDQPCQLRTGLGENPHAPAPSKASIRDIATFIGSDDDYLAFDLDPVDTSPLRLWSDFGGVSAPRPAYLCSGAPLTFTPHLVAGRERLTLTQHAVTLGPYARSSVVAKPEKAPTPSTSE